MRRRFVLNLLGVIVVAFAATLGLVAAAHSPVKAQTTDGAPAWLIAQAQQIAANNGDASPSAAAYCLTTRRKYFDAIGEPGQPAAEIGMQVYLVMLTGHFVDKDASYPPGASAPQGTILVYTADSRSHGVLDSGVQNAPLDTKTIGPMFAFTLQ